MDRRNFLLNTCRACAGLALAPVLGSTLESCGSSATMLTVENGYLNVPMDTFGSGNTAVVQAKELANKLMLVKRADGTYTALELNCPHKGGPLNEKNGQIDCGWHHSRFDLEGKLVNGPAKTDLKTYPAESDGKMVKVKVLA